jgi:ABC-type lipoprotein export system ATPase subunit
MATLEGRQRYKVYRAASAAEVSALCEVSLGLPARSFTLLTGPSGSGKTTLLALLGALERPTSGQVLHDGRDLAGCSDVELARQRRRLGFVFQDFALIPELTVGDNITYPLIPRSVNRAQRLARDLLEGLGLAGRLRALPRELSGREQQRVAVARALAGRRCCWPTSRPRTWTKRPARPSSSFCNGRTPRARRSSSPPTTPAWRPWRRRWSPFGAAGSRKDRCRAT